MWPWLIGFAIGCACFGLGLVTGITAARDRRR